MTGEERETEGEKLSSGVELARDLAEPVQRRRRVEALEPDLEDLDAVRRRERLRVEDGGELPASSDDVVTADC